MNTRPLSNVRTFRFRILSLLLALVLALTLFAISAATWPAPDAQMTAMKYAIAASHPVIALIHGADLGRGSAYGDHWVVVTGFSDDTTVYLNDPDLRDPSNLPSGWINGGQISLD